jgi:hypothetical protein
MKSSDQQPKNTRATPDEQVLNACSFLFSKIREEKMSKAKTTQDDLDGRGAHDHARASHTDHGSRSHFWVYQLWSSLSWVVVVSHLPWWLPLVGEGTP